MPRAVRYSLMCLPSSTSFPSLIQGCHDGCHFTIKRLWRRGSFVEIALQKVFDKAMSRGYEGMGLRTRGRGDAERARRAMGGFAGVAGEGGVMPHSSCSCGNGGRGGGGGDSVPVLFHASFVAFSLGLMTAAMGNREVEGVMQSTSCPGARCSPRLRHSDARADRRATCSARCAPVRSSAPARTPARRPCGIIPDFWPPNRALARDSPLLDAGRGSRSRKAQVG